jgi:hypothetical protein
MFVLTWFDQDKSRVQISYNNGLNLLERSIEISTDDLIIIGRTYYQVKIISNDRIDFFPIKNPFRIDLIESGCLTCKRNCFSLLIILSGKRPAKNRLRTTVLSIDGLESSSR